MKGILENASRYTQTNNFEETAAELEGIGHARIICADVQVLVIIL